MKLAEVGRAMFLFVCVCLFVGAMFLLMSVL